MPRRRLGERHQDAGLPVVVPDPRQDGDDPRCPVPRGRQGECGQPLKGGTVCQACLLETVHLLRLVPGILGDLAPLIRREASLAAGPGTRSVPGPRPPVNVHLVDLRDELTAHLRAAALSVHPGPPWALPPVTPALLAMWLVQHLQREHAERARTRPDAVVIVTNLRTAITRTQRATERVDDRVRVLCPSCGERVPMPVDPCGEDSGCPGCVEIHCRGCDAWGVRSWWIEHAAPPQEPTTITRLPMALHAAGWIVPPRRLRDWADRGLLREHSRDSRGRRLYDPAAAAVLAGRMQAKKRHARAN